MVNGKNRILVMDDDDVVRKLFCHILSEHYDVVAVGDRFHAVKIFVDARTSKAAFALVVLDLQGRHESDEGFRALERLRGIDPGVKAILHTGSNPPRSESELRDMGFSCVLRKPSSRETILNTIGFVL